MKELTNWTELLYQSLFRFFENAMAVIPNIISAVLILLLGWLFAKLVSAIFRRALKTMKFDTLAERLSVADYLEKANVKLSPSALIGKMIYWILLLLVFLAASDALGWDRISKQLNRFLEFLADLFVALLVFIIGIYIAGIIRDLIRGTTASIGLSTGKIAGNLVFYFLFIVVSITALEQAGMDTSLITSNLLVIIGTIFVAGAISYGFASRDILSNILAGYFSRRTFVIGQVIEVNGVSGKIIEMSNISITILSSEKVKIVIPSHELIVSKVKIISG